MLKCCNADWCEARWNFGESECPHKVPHVSLSRYGNPCPKVRCQYASEHYGKDVFSECEEIKEPECLIVFQGGHDDMEGPVSMTLQYHNLSDDCDDVEVPFGLCMGDLRNGEQPMLMPESMALKVAAAMNTSHKLTYRVFREVK